jgi:N utilization substance protein A
MPDFNWQGRQPRAVQADGMVNLIGTSYGPLSEELFRRQVDVEIKDGVVEIYYDRDLRARFDQLTAELLPLDATEQVGEAELETTTVGESDEC